MKKVILTLLLIAPLMAHLSCAQEAKYKVKIITEKDGKKEVYEKSYSTREEMANDPNLKDMEIIHLDSIKGNAFSFDSDSSVVKMIIKTDGKELFDLDTEQNVMIFGTGDGENSVEILTGGSGDSDANVFVFKNGEETIEIKKDIKIDGNSFMWKDSDGNIEIDTDDDRRVIVKSFGGGTFVHKAQSISLQDASTSEIQAANYASDKVLTPKSIEYVVDAATSTLNLKFQAKASAVSVQVRDSEGAQVFGETIDPFNGIYNSSIDMSGQDSGTYILEIRQGQKALHKKLVVE